MSLLLGEDVPLRQFSCIAEGHVYGSSRVEGAWKLFDKRYWPGHSLTDHLTFALKHEELDLLVLKRIFAVIPEGDLTAFVGSRIKEKIPRLAWFYYEFLTGRKLQLPDMKVKTADYVDVLDPKRHYTLNPERIKRYLVRNNLLGNSSFCPLIKRTDKLEKYISLGLNRTAQKIASKTHDRTVDRSASFMLLKDSQATFAIENEHPPRSILMKWAQATKNAAGGNLNIELIEELQKVLLADSSKVQIGIRESEVFLATQMTNYEIDIGHYGARSVDLHDLVNSLLLCNSRMGDGGLDPVLHAVAISFGFIYIHPLQDGNGRMHRHIVNHVLAEREYAPKGMMLPISYVLLDLIKEYGMILDEHSLRLLRFIESRENSDHGIDIMNDTADLYRYFDCTKEAEFIYSCIERMLTKDIPEEIDYLQKHDLAFRSLKKRMEMPDMRVSLLVNLVRQNDGKLSKAKRKVFSELSDEEVADLEKIINSAFSKKRK